jgi:hypothetical protein
MARHMNPREIQKRVSILLARKRDPTVGYRALARQFQTSLRVVCDAMTRSVAEWREVLAELEGDVVGAGQPVPFRPSGAVPHAIYPEAADSADSGDEDAGFDPERDADPDDYRGR